MSTPSVARDVSGILMLIGVVVVIIANLLAFILKEFHKNMHIAYVLMSYAGVVLMVAGWVVMDLETNIEKENYEKKLREERERYRERYCSSCPKKNQGLMHYPGVM